MTLTADNPTATDRLIDKLHDPAAVYSSSQVAYLMGVAAQWSRDIIDGEPSPLTYRAGFAAGYRARVAEENAAYPPEPLHLTTTARQDAVAVYRSRIGVDTVVPRPEDFGGLGAEYVAELRERWALDGDDQS
jgi:hypothetical protein